MGIFCAVLVAWGVGGWGVSWNAAPETPVIWKIPASATDGGDDMRMATGAVSDDVEGVFFLDARLGKLICSIYNPASSTFNSFFQRDVAADMQLDGVQKPKFLLVTGALNGPRRSSQMIGNSIVYVLETTSSRFAAYGIPWRGDLYASGRPQVGSLLLLHVGLAREGTGSP
jgi:hypothetical protein